MQQFKEFQIKDYTYRVNRYFIFIALILIAIMLGYILYLDKFSGETKYYSSCPTSEKDGCFNAFYNSNLCLDGTISATNPLCTTKHMFPGQSIGTPPPFIVKNFSTISIIILLLTIIINHFLYNKNFFRLFKGEEL